MSATSRLVHADALAGLAQLRDHSVHALVTDPPAPLLAARTWAANRRDASAWIAWLQGILADTLRVVKPGGHALVWSSPRTSHWVGMALENAGWEPRDCIYHLFGSGFPKSQDVGRAIALQELPEAATWAGWGTGLKPAAACWWLARSPLASRTVTANVLAHGTGALNIQAGRIPVEGMPGEPGRWPTNVILSCCGEDPHREDCTVHVLDSQAGPLASGYLPGGTERGNRSGWAGPMPSETLWGTYGDAGSASRFYYVARASARERSVGLEQANPCPNVKPLALMRYLVPLVTPPGGTVLDTFCGSGTTGMACREAGFSFIGIDNDAEVLEVAARRIAAAPTPHAARTEVA